MVPPPPQSGPEGDPGPALPDDLVDAVVGAVTRSLVPGTLTWFGSAEAGEGVELPYATLGEPDQDDSYWSTDDDELAEGALEISCYHRTRREAFRLGGAVKAAIQDAPLRFHAGTLIYLRQSGRSLRLDPDPAPGGGDCWQEVRQFAFKFSH